MILPTLGCHLTGCVPLRQAKEAEDSSKAASASTGGKYVPPFMKEGAKMRGESMMGARGRGESGAG